MLLTIAIMRQWLSQSAPSVSKADGEGILDMPRTAQETTEGSVENGGEFLADECMTKEELPVDQN
jgi:hypothetical protein